LTAIGQIEEMDVLPAGGLIEQAYGAIYCTCRWIKLKIIPVIMDAAG